MIHCYEEIMSSFICLSLPAYLKSAYCIKLHSIFQTHIIKFSCLSWEESKEVFYYWCLLYQYLLLFMYFKYFWLYSFHGFMENKVLSIQSVGPF